MNNIILDKESIVNLNISEDSICNIDSSYNINKLNINIKNNAKLVINHYSIINEHKLDIDINQLENTSFIYNHNFKNSDKYNLNINILLKSNNTKNNINIHGVTDGGISNININGKVYDKTINNELNENIKLLNINNGKSNAYPNMFIDTKNVSANHSVSITNINKDYLFYLNSKGLDKDNSTNLIVNGFLNGIIENKN